MSWSPELSDSHQPESLTIRDVLKTPGFAGTDVLAGSGGLDRVVSSVNVMENPSITPWVKGDELLITVGYSLAGENRDLAALVDDLADLGLAGFGVKLGPFIIEIDDATLAAAERRDFPILSLPSDVSFDDLIADVYRARGSLLLGGMHRKSDRERELMSVALAGGGLAEVAERLASLTRCEVLVLGPGNDVLAHHRAGGGVAIDGRGHLTEPPVAEAVTAPIVFGSTYVGRLYVVPNRGPVASFFPGLVPTSAQIMALAASREIAVASVDRQFRAEFLEQLLRHRLDERDVQRRCQALDWSISYPAVIVSLSPAELDATPYLERMRDALGFALRTRGLHAPHAIINGDVVAVVGDVSPADGETIAADAANEVIAGSPTGSWSAGVSGPVDGPSELAKAWSQAQMATAVTRTIRGVGWAGKFTDLGVFRLLSEVDPFLLDDFASDALGELHHPTTPNREDLRRTLAYLLDHNLNVAATAKALGYHYNSIRYRVSRLERMLGPFADDPTRRLELHIALLIGDMAADRSESAHP